jgi:putative tributyrin esterase
MSRVQIVTNKAPGVALDIIAPEYLSDERLCGVSEEDFYNKKHRCLWLLHGMGGTSSDWLRYSMIEVFAREKGIFVVCPSAESGFYTNSSFGDMWETHIMTDLWNYVHNLFPLMSDKREENFIAGLSMGGYGAMRYALNHPDKFSFGASLSGGLNVPQRFSQGENINGYSQYYFGPPESAVGSDHDMYVLAKRLKDSNKALPALHVACGDMDPEYEPNKAFYNYLLGLGYDVSWDEGNYAHEWRFWNIQIEKLLLHLIPDYHVVHRRKK